MVPYSREFHMIVFIFWYILFNQLDTVTIYHLK